MTYLWSCTNFTGHWGVGTAAIIIAKSAAIAKNRLNKELKDMGLPGDAEKEDMECITCLCDLCHKALPKKQPNVIILNDGNY